MRRIALRACLMLAVFPGLLALAVPARAALVLYVANPNGTINRYNPDTGAFLSTFVTLSTLPTDLTFDAAGNLYVSASVAGTVLKITPAGAVSTYASGFSLPTGIAFDTAGNLFVSNENIGTITKVTPGGAQSTFATGLTNPEGLAFDASGNLYVAAYGGNLVRKYTPAGVGSTFATYSTTFSGPVGLAFDSAGNLYAGHQGSNTVFKTTPGGVTSPYITAGQVYPGRLAIDASNRMFVANYGFGSGWIDRFDASGNFLGQIFVSDHPRGLALFNETPLAAVPEPGTLALAGLGAAVACAVARRRRHSPA